MSLFERINSDLKEAMKAKNTKKIGVLRLLLSSLKNKIIDNELKGKGNNLSDEETSSILQNEAKKRRESASIFSENKRTDLASKENEELEIILEFLPSQMSKDEIQSFVKKFIEKEKPSDFGSAMKKMSVDLRGKADGKVVSEIVKSFFNN